MPFVRLMLVCVVTAAWAFSFGLGTQATSHWLKLLGASDTLVGFVHAAYYLGVAIASLAVPSLTRRLGLRTCIAGLVLSAVSLAVFPFVSGGPLWLLARFLSGAGCAFTLVPMEAYVSRHAPVERRAEMFAYYAVALTLAGAIGIAVGLEGFNDGGLIATWIGPVRNAFFLGAVFPLVGAIVGLRGLAMNAWDEDESGAGWTWSARRHFLSFGTAFGQGFLEGGMLAFLSLDLVRRGLNASEAGILMGATMVGVIAFQAPVAWIADRLGRTPTLLVCYAVTIAGLLAAPWCGSMVVLGTCLFLFGAFSGAMYPVGLSLLDDDVPASALSRAYAWYLTIECVGSQAGAAIMGLARDGWGPSALFYVPAGLFGLLLLTWTCVRRRHPYVALPEHRRAA